MGSRWWGTLASPRLPCLVLLAAAFGCRGSLSPLSNRLAVGQEAYVVFVAAGEGGGGDLFASSAGGGPVYPVSYTRVDESGPALSPDGVSLAFIRSRSTADSLTHAVWVMNLLSGEERALPPAEPGSRPMRIGWSKDGKTIYVRTDQGIDAAHAPPSAPEPRALRGDTAAADSALSVWVGEPVFAGVRPCPSEDALCVFPGAGPPQAIAPGSHDPVRWGRDSLGYFVGADLYVRPLGPGAQRRLTWSPPPVRPREPTYFSPPPTP